MASAFGQRAGLAVIAAACGDLLSGCAATASKFPELEAHRTTDTQITCPAIDRELVDADVLREAILRERRDLNALDAIDGASDLIFEPFSGAVAVALRERDSRRREADYARTTAAAEQRLRVLLELREQRGCGPAGAPFSDGGAPDAALEALRAIDAERAAGTLSEAEAAKRRRSLFDRMR